MKWRMVIPRFYPVALTCLFVSVCLRDSAAEVLLLGVTSERTNFYPRTISSIESWQGFVKCACGRERNTCSADLRKEFFRTNTFSTFTFMYVNIKSADTTDTRNYSSESESVFLICSLLKESRSDSADLECKITSSFDYTTMCGSVPKCSYLLSANCPDSVNTITMAWNSSQTARVVLYNSDYVNLVHCCPSTTVPTTLTITNITTTLTVTTMAITDRNTSDPLSQDSKANDNNDDDISFSGFHIGVIIAVSLASVVVTLIVVVVVWKLRKKQNGKVPAAPQAFSISDAVSRDNTANDDDDKANPEYENTYTYTDTDVQSSSLQTVMVPHFDAENQDLPGDTVNIGVYTLANPGSTDTDDGHGDGDLTTVQDESGQYYYTTPGTMRVETEQQPYSKLGDRPIAMKNVYDQLQPETE